MRTRLLAFSLFQYSNALLGLTGPLAPFFILVRSSHRVGWQNGQPDEMSGENKEASYENGTFIVKELDSFGSAEEKTHWYTGMPRLIIQQSGALSVVERNRQSCYNVDIVW